METINKSRQKIVDDIRRATISGGINHEMPRISFIDKERESEEKHYERFMESLKTAGAGVVVLDVSELERYLEVKFPEVIDCRERIVWESYKGMKPVEMEAKAGHVLISGKLGVAENGAVWIDETCCPERLLPFIAGKLILLVGEERIVPDMHAAYAIIDEKLQGFGVFISGPSKTADIEQSLVYGAHGAISLDVIILRG
jgi:L-lactate dehydrogenase complex protein LldG